MAIESFNALDAAPASDTGALSGAGALEDIICAAQAQRSPTRGKTSAAPPCSLLARLITGADGGARE